MATARRLAVAVVLAAFLGGCAWVALGPPPLAAAAGFLGGTSPTQAGAVAAAVLLAWIPVGLGGVGVVILTGRAALRRAGSVQRGQWIVSVVLLVGVTVLAGGLVRHATDGPALHGGSLAQAEHLLDSGGPGHGGAPTGAPRTGTGS
ncbi:MAG TPA: hypothetical protein VMW49_06435 [Candidatus Dormibacteraeota bacterium]|nr:hypothetical protein [Candidatus Dormibacteraeota bacterium]